VRRGSAANGKNCNQIAPPEKRKKRSYERGGLAGGEKSVLDKNLKTLELKREGRKSS